MEQLLASRNENDASLQLFLYPEALLKEIGLEQDKHYQKENDKFKIKKCFFCSDDSYSFQIDSVSGAWNCSKCKNFGNYENLKSYVYDEFGYSNVIPASYKESTQEKAKIRETLSFKDYESKYILPLWTSDNPAFNWLQYTNKLNDSTINAFHLGFNIIDDRHFVAIPYFDNRNNVIYLKYRWASDEKGAYRSFVDSKINNPILYNNNIPNNAKEIFVVKNEMDCWALYQLGYKNVVAIPQTETNSYKYAEPLKERTCRINLMFSNKYADKALIKDTIDFIGKIKTYQINLPYEIFRIFKNFPEQEAKDIIDIAIKNAKKSTLSDIIDINTAFSEVILELAQPKNGISLSEGINTPWKTINKHIPIIRWGNLVAIGANSGSGKSTIALQWANYLTNELGIPTFFLCLEMNKTEHIYKLTELIKGEHNLGNLDYVMEAHIETPYDSPFYIARKVTERSDEELLTLIENAVIEHNLKVVFFDHFQFVTFFSSATKNRTDALSYAQFANSLKFFAEKMNIVFICLSQLRKIDKYTIPTMDDLRETSGLKDAASVGILLHRRIINEDTDKFDIMSSISPKSSYTLFIIGKVRLGGKESMDFLKYHNGKLIDVPDDCIEDIAEEKRALFSKNKFIRR